MIEVYVAPSAPDAATTLTPTLRNRYFPVDFLRGIGLLGILLMNLPDFALPESTVFYQQYAHPGDANYTANFVISVLFAGKMRALFSILFGTGVLLFTGHKEAASAGSIVVADLYYRRMLWLVVFGVVDGFLLLWYGDVLYWYGLVGLLLFPVRNVAPARLLVGAGLCMAFLAGQSLWRSAEITEKRAKHLTATALVKKHKKLTDEQQADTTAWKSAEKSVRYDPKKAAEEIKEMHGNYADIWHHLRPLTAQFQSTYFYQGFWDALGMMLLGMALFKLGVLTNQVSRNTYWLLLLIGYGIGIPLGCWVIPHNVEFVHHFARYIDTHWFSPERFTYEIRRTSMVLGHIGLVMLVFRTGLLTGVFRVLAAVGQMALSNYVLHTLICTTIFYGFGFGYFGQFQYYQTVYFVVAIWAVNILFSVVWLHYFRFGPLEWLWRSLTYWQRQPIKKPVFRKSSIA